MDGRTTYAGDRILKGLREIQRGGFTRVARVSVYSQTGPSPRTRPGYFRGHTEKGVRESTMTSFILVILLYGGNGPFMKLVEGFTTQASCVKAAQDFNGFAQNKDTGAMAFCIEKK